VEVIQQTMDDLQIRAARQFNREQIYGIFGVPLGLVSGEISSENVYAILHTFAMNTIQPLMDAFAAQWTLAIRPYYEENFEVRAPNLIPQDRALGVQEFAQYSLSRTVNENRAVLGLGPVDIDICKRVPVRLLRLLQSPGDATIMQDKMGTLLGAEAPERLVNRLTDTGTDVERPPMSEEEQAEQGSEDRLLEQNRALLSAANSELGKWKKVACKEASRGRSPSEREFGTAVIPNDIVEAIKAQLALAGTDKDLIETVFRDAADNLAQVLNG